ncbi:zinc transport system substrate-binding protein [Melghirimyces profundicolus]|uniref:Zinc transport system substrate-binding protein n=1 Tax=Melghirimyces profundicolus TaxID=1242148 RepID=A0A2T6BW43_9BACL|nr:metal ABC transporter substrate-binding protein [Melghirimyces profundicolus]PTX60295.1 zinc transport system substrate-binding protein [Melghirimyces profundicolus]
MNRAIIRVGILVLVVLLAASGCSSGGGDDASADGKLKVQTSMYPLAFFAEEIGGKHVEVTHAVPAGADPHSYEPTAREVVEISEADVFLYNGVGFEGWIDQVKKTLDGEKTTVVETAKGIPLIEADEAHGHHEEEHGHSQEEGHGHGDHDPHVWLDPLRAKKQAATIRDALVKKDPEHKEAYEKNYDKLAGKLDRLHEKFKKTVEKGDKKTFVVSHAAFGYIADRYGLNQVAVSGLSPSDEPSAKELREVVKIARKHKVNYILFETLVNGKVAKAVQKEVGARSLTLHPLEGLTPAEKKKGENYFTLMEKNIDHLGKALGAK